MMHMPKGNRRRSTSNVGFFIKIKKIFARIRKQAIDKLSVPENFFLVFAGFFGFLFVFLIPPMQSPDEHAHFYKAYQTSDFKIFPNRYEQDGKQYFGESIPKSVYEEAKLFKDPVAGRGDIPFESIKYRQHIMTPLKPDVRVMTYEAANGYSFVNYLPQSIGIGIGKIFQASPLILIWLGRIANLVAWIALIYLALKFLPFAKWGLVILALNPVTLTLASSLSSDAMNIALAFLFVSLVFSLIASKNKKDDSTVGITRNDKLTLVVVALALSLTKVTNIALLPLLLLINKDIFENKRKAWLFCIGTLGAAIILGLAWNASMSEVNKSGASLQRPGVVQSGAQLEGIIENPLHYGTTVLMNYVFVERGSSADAVIDTYFGIFGWLDTAIPTWVQLLYVSGLLIAVLYQLGRGKHFSLGHKMSFLSIFTIVVVGSITAMYLYYTPVGARIVEGVQGRYFMPATILLLGLFTGKKKLLENYDKSMVVWLGLIMLIVMTMTTIKLFARYY